MNNNFYKIIFSRRLGCLIAVGEHTSSSGKSAIGHGCRGAAHPLSIPNAKDNEFISALRQTAVSVILALLPIGALQAQSVAPSISATALPKGGSLGVGSAIISANGAQMAINQTSDKASINWQSFNVGSAASVNINQPNASSVLLNRVVGNDPSQILGKLSANGQVILLNPNGILFGKDGSVTASAFTASTFGLSDNDFMAGYYKYSRNGSTASVVNQGTIQTAPGGFVVLIGATVSNEGKIIAPQGDVVLAAGEQVTLPQELTDTKPSTTPNTVSVRMSKRVRLEIDAATINTAVSNTNSGVIVTEGGQVLLQAAALSSAVASVTQSGSIDTSAAQAGAVTVLAENGLIKVDGAIKANSNGDTNGALNRGGNIIIGRNEETGALAKATDVSGAQLESNHGLVETSGDHLRTDNITVRANEWLLDPANINIVSDATADSNNWSPAIGSGTTQPNASATTSNIRASTIKSQLDDGVSVTISTTNNGTSASSDGNITVSSAINKTAGGDASLTLIADNGIDVNANIASTVGKLNLSFTANGNAATAANSKGFTVGYTGGSGISIDGNGGTVVINGTTKNTLNGFPGRIGSTIYGSVKGGAVTINGTSNVASASDGIGILFQMGSYVEATTGALNITGQVLGAGSTGRGVIVGNGGSSATPTFKASQNVSITGVAPTKSILIDTAGADITSTNGSISLLGDNWLLLGSKFIVNSATGTTLRSTIGQVSSTSTIQNTGGITIDSATASTFSGAISGTGGLTISGPSTTTLSAANTFSGTTLISGGTLALTNVNALQGSTLNTGIASSQAVTFGVTGTNTYNIGGLQGTKSLSIGSNSISVGANNSTTTFDGNLTSTGTGSLTKVGTGTLTLTGSLGTSTNGGLSTNYNALSTTGSSVNVTAKAASVSATATALTYNGTTQNQTAETTSGFIAGDNISITGQASGKNANTYTSNLQLTGIDASNYNIAINNADLVIGKANLSATGTKVYDANTNFAGNNFTRITGVNGESFTATGSATLASANVQNNQALSNLGTISLTGLNGESTSNYNTLTAAQTSVSITARTLTITGANTSTTYSGLAQSNLTATIVDAQGSDSFTVTGYATGTHASTTPYVDNLSVTGNGTTSLNNYAITYSNGALNIGKANLTLAGSRIYDASTAFAGSGLTARGVHGETFTVTGSGDSSNLISKNVQTSSALNSIAGLSLGASSNGGLSTNYNALSTTGSSVNVTAKSASVSATATTLTYIGATQNQSTETTSGFIAGDNISVTGQASGKNANTYTSSLQVTGTDASNYNIAINNADLVIDRAALTVTANPVTKTYDNKLTAAGSPSVGSLAGANAGEVVNNAGTQAFLDANAGTSKVVRASGVTVRDANYVDVSNNYNITYIDNSTSTINKAVLTVIANNDARFVTLSDVSGFNGVSYKGFVGSDNSSVLGGALTITRQNANTNVAAGTYTGVLAPNGLTSTNYDIRNENGNYTIVPARTLLIRTTNQSLTYGSNPTYTTTAQYLDGFNVIHTLTQSAHGNTLTLNDGAEGSATLTLNLYTSAGLAASSTSGKTVVGNYEIKDTNPTIVGRNFEGTPIFTGNLTINAKALTPNASNVSKVYDATTSMSNVTLGLTGAISNDKLEINGTGAFTQKNAGTNLGYTISNLVLTGDDASNYYLTGRDNSFTGANGIITPAPISLSTASITKTYDGNTTATGSLKLLSGTKLFGSDVISGGSYSFTNSNVGSNKVVQVSGAIINDGNEGNNYAITYFDNTNSAIVAKETSGPNLNNIDLESAAYRSSTSRNTPFAITPNKLPLIEGRCAYDVGFDCGCRSEIGGTDTEGENCTSSKKFNMGEFNTNSKI